MTGRQAVHSHRQRVDAAFSRVQDVAKDAEVLSDFAKYLCILVAGFIERSFSEIMLEHARQCGSPSLQRFVEKNTCKFTNANTAKILQFMGSFDPEWRDRMESFLVDEKKAAIDSIYGLRNSIAHGASTGLTYARIEEYYTAVKSVVEHAENMCIPNPPV